MMSTEMSIICGKASRMGQVGDFGNGPAAEPRKGVALQPPDDLVGVARRPVQRIFGKPFTHDDFEAVLAAVGERRLPRLAMFAGIDISRELLAGFDNARQAAGVNFQFRDIRAKSATDAEDLQYAQKLPGTSTNR